MEKANWNGYTCSIPAPTRLFMNINNYGDLLAAARSQAQPQRMLFAFARAEAPDSQGRGVPLLPVMCVDKTPEELGTFDELVAESRHTGADWDIVFVSTMSGRDGKAPPAAAAEAPLNMMVTYIHTGQVERFLAFDKTGQLLAIKNQ
jgi:hypothetical protein